jgi:demethylmenaquinone methyltransferase/2-methoxy-6-polyprenyl-1,4-benzoquinol methylase
MFDRIAPRYDLLNRVMSLGQDRRWRRALVAALGLGDGRSRVLDLATGTADVAIAIARRHAGAAVVGLDPSREMLARGRGKLGREGAAAAERVALVAGDAQELPFAAGSFDACSIAFGIRNVPDRARALSEMARVTRAGGRVVVLELGTPREGWLSALARLHVRHVVPRLGAWLSRSREYAYLERSIAAFPPPALFAAELARAGLEVLATRPFALGATTLFVARVPPVRGQAPSDEAPIVATRPRNA